MDKYEALRQTFGYSSFRSGQEQIVDALLSGRDALCVMPTGAGKSICFQIPALLLPGVALVISPLISLMKDQVASLNQAGVRAAYLNSSLTPRQYARAIENACSGMYKIIYVAPERLETYEFRELCRETEVSLLAVDEAHCVSQWGQDFRPRYLRIRAFIESLPRRPVVGAFTATATEEVQADIVKLLNLQDPFRMTTGFDRPNLRFEVRTPHKKDSELLDILAEMRDRSGIVYCSTRKNVEEVCSLLCANGYAATRYHAGLGDAERRDNQDDFLYDRKTVMVATNAFGMGIDKSNVGFVIHYNMPKNLESYYQEAGRAGRDGSDAVCILLYSPQDVFTNNLLIERESDNPELSPEEAAAVKEKLRLGLRRMTQYCTTTGCLRSDMLRYFGEQAMDFCGNCSNCSAEYREEDATQAARAILECVMELRQRFGRTVVSEVVRGRKTARIAKLGLDQCRSFGVLQGQDEREISSLMDTMTEKNLLAADGSEYPVVRLGAEAKDFLDDGLAFSIRIRTDAAQKDVDAAASRKTTKQKRGGEVEDGNPLLADLRRLRLQLAARAHVPAYIIFSDATLRDMCAKKPETREEFLQVSGVGEHKLNRYGRAFLEVIQKHLHGQNQ